MANNKIIKICRLTILSVGIMGLTACGDNENQNSNNDVRTAEAVHERTLTMDSHVDISSDYTYMPEYDPGQLSTMKVDLPKMQKGGLDAAFFIVYVGQTERTAENYDAAKKLAIRKFNAIHRMTDELYSDQIGMALHPDDVRRIYNEGRKVAIIGIENGYVIGKDIALVEDFYNRGARYMTLAHNGHNDICDSAQAKEKFGDKQSEHGGVSVFGKQVIGRMNRLGMMVDISHVSVDCMMQAVGMSKAPAIASHSSVRALVDHPRNLTDKQMKFLADNGGVMQLVAYTGFVKADPARSDAIDDLASKVAALHGLADDDYENIEKTSQWKEGAATIDQKYPIATVSEFIDHVDYAVKLIGIDHVGISSDFDGGGEIIGWRNAAESLNITRELLLRGYSEENIAKIWGGNLLRVWAEVENVAARLQKTSVK